MKLFILCSMLLLSGCVAVPVYDNYGDYNAYPDNIYINSYSTHTPYYNRHYRGNTPYYNRYYRGNNRPYGHRIPSQPMNGFHNKRPGDYPGKPRISTGRPYSGRPDHYNRAETFNPSQIFK